MTSLTFGRFFMQNRMPTDHNDVNVSNTVLHTLRGACRSGHTRSSGNASESSHCVDAAAALPSACQAFVASSRHARWKFHNSNCVLPSPRGVVQDPACDCGVRLGSTDGVCTTLAHANVLDDSSGSVCEPRMSPSWAAVLRT